MKITVKQNKTTIITTKIHRGSGKAARAGRRFCVFPQNHILYFWKLEWKRLSLKRIINERYKSRIALDISYIIQISLDIDY